MSEANDHIIGILQITRQMLYLADRGDAERKDTGCGIVFGTLRDYAYKLRKMTLNEVEEHKKTDNWDEEYEDRLKQQLLS